MKKFRALSCFVFALCIVFYAVPRLPFQGISEMATGFSFIWMAFAMLVIGSNLLYVTGTDRSNQGKLQRRHYTFPSEGNLQPLSDRQEFRSEIKR